MECHDCREVLSARMDGEHHPNQDADAHLVSCPECRLWYDDAATVTRMARTSLVTTSVDVTDEVVPRAPGRKRATAAMILRIALAATGLAQLGLGVLQLVAAGSAGGHAHGGALLDGLDVGHIGYESAAWDVALGVAFVWIAARRGRPLGLLPLLSVFVAALLLLNINDLVADRIDASHAAVHTFVVVGYLIILALAHPRLATHQPPPERARAASRASSPHGSTDIPDDVESRSRWADRWPDTRATEPRRGRAA